MIPVKLKKPKQWKKPNWVKHFDLWLIFGRDAYIKQIQKERADKKLQEQLAKKFLN